MMGLRAYEQHKAITLHFKTSNYDYFKYNGKTRISANSFVKSPLKYAFYNFEKYKINDIERACYLWWVHTYRPATYHRVPFNPKNVRDYKVWCDNITTQLKNDVELVDVSKVYDIINIWPELIELYDSKQVSLLTVLLFDMYYKPFINNVEVDDPIRWPSLKEELCKHRGFISYIVNIENIQSNIQNTFI